MSDDELLYEGDFPKPWFDVSVQTLIYRNDGSLFFDGGIMRWPRVNDTIHEWFVLSCKTTAFWLIEVPEAVGPKSYTLRYRTIVKTLNGDPVSDTTMLEFEKLTYLDVVRFQRWALQELNLLVDLFERQHAFGVVHVRSRNKLLTMVGLGWQFLRNKICGSQV